MSALPLKADIRPRDHDVCFGPEAEVAVIRSVELIVQPGAKDVVGEMGVGGDSAGRARKNNLRRAGSKRRCGI